MNISQWKKPNRSFFPLEVGISFTYYTLPPAIEAVHKAGYCVTAIVCSVAGLGWALQLHIKYQILQRHSKHFSCLSYETRARGHQQ